jgi:hypothetical protein
MSILFIDGFDIYPNIESTSDGLQASWITHAEYGSITTGRFGGQAVKMQTAGGTTINSYFYKAFDAATSNTSVGFAGMITEYDISSDDAPIMFFGNSTTQLIGIGYNNQQKMFIWSGSLTNVVATMNGKITPDSWHYYELTVALGTSGTVTLYIDGLQACTYTGDIGTTQINRLTFGPDDPSFFAHLGIEVSYDDVYCTNTATRLGECRVQTLVPSGDATVTWTPSTGNTNYNLVNSLPAPTTATQNVYSSTPGQQDLYNITSLTGNPTAISAVQIKVCAQKDDSGTRTIAPVNESSSVTTVGTEQALSANLLYYSNLYETDPATSAAWTTSGVNNLKIGQKVIN